MHFLFEYDVFKKGAAEKAILCGKLQFLQVENPL